MPTEKSAALYKRATAVLPGGVNSPVRAMGSVGRDHPVFIAEASGATIIDIDGNRYLDWFSSWEPLIAGHAHPEVIAAIADAAARGTSFGAPTETEVEIAEEIRSRYPAAEVVRMVNSGTEAAMSAIRLARGATGRDRIIKFAGAYHGHSDGLLAEAGSGALTLGIPASAGVTRGATSDTIVIGWGDLDAVDTALAKGDVAAIICEPVPANMGVVPPPDGFLHALRERTEANDALLIFDEVITGFRVARGGMAEITGINPDLAVFGKIIGGGLPAAAYAGRADLMNQVAPVGPVYQAGTLSGNPLATAAGLATLRLLDDDAYLRLAELDRRFSDGLARIAAVRPGITIGHAPTMSTIFFNDGPVTDFESAKRSDTDRYGRFWNELFDQGIYAPPSQFETWFVSLAHDEEMIDTTLEAIDRAITASA